jgi:hypothetical protein
MIKCHNTQQYTFYCSRTKQLILLITQYIYKNFITSKIVQIVVVALSCRKQ